MSAGDYKRAKEFYDWYWHVNLPPTLDVERETLEDWIELIEDTLDLPDVLANVIAEKIICKTDGHLMESDQCGIPGHETCIVCNGPSDREEQRWVKIG